MSQAEQKTPAQIEAALKMAEDLARFDAQQAEIPPVVKSIKGFDALNNEGE